MNDQDIAIANLLKKHDISFTPVFLRKGFKDNWECYQFTCILGSESFEYNKGIGHCLNRASAKQYIRKYKSKYEGRLIAEVNFAEFVKMPTSAELIYSLLMDSFTAQDTFEGFCDCCGYDTDSRKALDMYLACQESGNKLRKVLDNSLIKEIEVILENY